MEVDKLTNIFRLTKEPQPSIVQGVEGYSKTLTLKEVVTLLNELTDRIDELEDDNKRYHLGKGEPVLENPRFKITGCPTEIMDKHNNHYYWLELEDNVKEICRILNQQDEIIQTLSDEKNKYNNERIEYLAKYNVTSLFEKYYKTKVVEKLKEVYDNPSVQGLYTAQQLEELANELGVEI